MKMKTLAVLLVILALLAGAGVLVVRLKTSKPTEGGLGSPLFKELPVNEILAIDIKGHDKSVSLIKNAQRWVVKNRFDYPADFSKITDLVRKLKEAKIGRKFESSEETTKRLSLKDPENPDGAENEKGTRLNFTGENEASIASILLGKTRMSGGERNFPDGQYLRLGKETQVYLIDKHFSNLKNEPSEWLEKSLLQVKGEEIQKIRSLETVGEKLRYLLERPEKGKELELKDLPSDAKVQKSSLGRLERALSSLRMEDIVDPSASPDSIGMEVPTRIEYHLFNGMIYRLYPSKACSEDDRCYLKIEVDYLQPPVKKEEAGEEETSEKTEKEEAGKEETSEKAEKEETPPEKSGQEMGLEAKELNERLSPWVYVIPKWKHGDFLTDFDQLLEKPDKKDE